jgi:ATP-dependent DNA ligase
MRSSPLLERKAWLAENVEPCAGLQLIEGVETHGEALFALAIEQDFEGIVAKRLDAPYSAGQHGSWLKIKNHAYSRPEALMWHGSR